MSAKSAETSNSVPLQSNARSPDNSSNNMSDDDSSSNSSATHNESPDPLQLSENDLQNSVESGNFLSYKKSEDESSSKRKNPESSDDDTNKKQKTEEINLNNVKTEQSTEDSSKSESDKEETDKNLTDLFEKEIKAAKEVDISELIPEKEEVDLKKEAESDSDDFDVTEKLKEMGEISVKAVSKTEASKKSEPAPDNVEITKKDKKEMQERKVTNFRKNIKDVIDDSQLDAATLAAQRQESERLARVQEQQRIIREMQRQIAMEKQSSKTQQKIMSFLQGHALKTSQASTSGESLLKSRQPDENNKVNLTPSVSIQPASSRSSLTPITIKSFETLDDDSDVEIQEKIEELKQLSQELESDDEDDDDDDDDDCRPIEEKKTIVTIDSSSDDDCIILSDDDEPEEEEDDPNNSGLHVKDSYNTPNSDGKVVVNIGHPENEPDIFVAPQIEKIIKPHQIGGVRFLFDNIIESVERFNTSTGFGCILAHSMGLGKTLQLVCFCDIFLRHTSSKTVLVIMPINTLQNWLNEFNMWLPAADDVDKCPLNGQGEVRPRNFKIHVLNDSQKTLNARAKVVMEWAKDGGVLMMGYEMYRLLSQKKMSKPKKSKKKVAEFLLAENVAEKTTSTEDQDMFDKIHEALVKPGPDLVVCDEGHRIKNSHASISLALKQIKSKRRIVLTGYPLQNNLMEYWCMVDFVRPNYLGSKTEFANMFERPIMNGQCVDSTPQDVKLMRYRAHVLHSLLLGFVQRRSHLVLQSCLPQKEEYVLLVRMTTFQRKLYDVFMNGVVRTKQVPNPLKAFSVCCKIWNHPDVLYNFLKKREADLEIELEETQDGSKNGSVNGETLPAGPKKRGRKKMDKNKDKDKEKGKQKPAATVTPNSSNSQPPVTPKSEVSNNSSDSNLTQLANLSVSGIPDAIIKQENGESDFKNPAATLNKPSTSSPSLAALLNTKSTLEPPPYQPPAFPSTSSSFNNFQNPSNYNYPYQSNVNQYSGNQNYYNSNGNNYWDGQYYQNRSNYWGNQPYWNNQSDSGYQMDRKPPPFPEPENKPVKMETDVKTEDVSSIPTSVQEVVQDKEKPKELDDDPLASLKEKEKEEKELGLTVKSSRDDGIPYEWAVELMKDYVSDLLENSPKMEIFFCILEESVRLGDRILVFSQSLLTLNLMERFLQRSKIPNSENCWAKNQSYFRLDGSTPALDREKLINEFNTNPNVKLFLVSTRAGSLGINLVGANRVIVFDASWNPCHDTQAVCRVYRYGQKKSCFVYRLVMDNCLEKKIYDRQINKQGMADRVVDECNPDAHLSLKEVTSLCWDDGVDPEIQDFSGNKDKHADLVTQFILEKHSKALTKEPFHHESLLVDRKEKKLSIAEKRMAKRGYELEKQAASKPSYGYNPIGTSYRAFRTVDGSIVHRPVASVRPMQAELGDINPMRSNVRPNRWIPAEVWQRQGMTAQEMTLPLDVVIPTSSADKQNIVLKAGQKVMVLKSPKGIYMQLDTGKIIAIRTSMKMNSGSGGSGLPLGHRSSSALGLDKPPTFASMQESAQTNNMPANLRNQALLTKNPRFSQPRSSLGQAPVTDDDVINISNDEDEEEEEESNEAKAIPETPKKSPPAIIQSVERIETPLSSLLAMEEKPIAAIEAQTAKHPIVQPLAPSAADSTYKEKVFKPNLVGRKPRVPPVAASNPTIDPTPAPSYNYNSGNYGNTAPPPAPSQPLPQMNYKPSASAGTEFPHTNYNSNYQSNYPAGSSRYYGNNSYNYNYPPPPNNNYPPKHQNPPQFHGGPNYQESGAKVAPSSNVNQNDSVQSAPVTEATSSSSSLPPISSTSVISSDMYRNDAPYQSSNSYYPPSGGSGSNNYASSSYQHQMYENPYPSNPSYLPNTQDSNSHPPPNYNYPYHSSYSNSDSYPPPMYPTNSNPYPSEIPAEPQHYPYQQPTEFNFTQGQPLPNSEANANPTVPNTYGQWNYNEG